MAETSAAPETATPPKIHADLVMGVPGRIVRQTTAEERERIKKTVDAYLRLQDEHRAGKYPGFTR